MVIHEPMSEPMQAPATHSIARKPVHSTTQTAVPPQEPVPIVLPADKEKPSDSESLENGSITPYTPARPTLRQRFDAILPPDRIYPKRLTRRALLFILIGLLLLLILMLGLGIGLGTKKKGGPVALPLPGNAEVHQGDLTFYDPGGPGFGACGRADYSTDAICAVSHLLYDAMATTGNPNDNPLCGRKIRITRNDERDGREKSVDVTVVDRCTGCEPNDIDLSLGMFDKIADEGLGRVAGKWAWLD